MHGITSIISPSVASPSQVAGMNALSSGTSFSVSALANLANQLALRGVSPTTIPSLGAQTVSALLQTQDISQIQSPGGHGGGGGYHAINLTPVLEAEPAAESEESQLLRRRKKLAKKLEAAKAEEDEASPDDVEQNEENRLHKKAG